MSEAEELQKIVNKQIDPLFKIYIRQVLLRLPCHITIVIISLPFDVKANALR
jgi:hypothetical protein